MQRAPLQSLSDPHAATQKPCVQVRFPKQSLARTHEIVAFAPPDEPQPAAKSSVATSATPKLGTVRAKKRTIMYQVPRTAVYHRRVLTWNLELGRDRCPWLTSTISSSSGPAPAGT